MTTWHSDVTGVNHGVASYSNPLIGINSVTRNRRGKLIKRRQRINAATEQTLLSCIGAHRRMWPAMARVPSATMARAYIARITSSAIS